MTICSRCLITDKYPGLHFNEQEGFSLCSSNKKHAPLGEDKLITAFEIIKQKKAK